MDKSKIFSYLKTGNEKKSIEWAYKHVFPSAKRYLLSNSGNEHQAEDLFQDALVKFLLKIRKNEIDLNSSVESYLFTMVKNGWINFLRKQKNLRYEDEVKEVAVSDEPFFKSEEEKEKKAQMEKMLNLIGEKCKKLLELTFYKGCSMDEVAERMGFNGRDVAKSYHYRCKKKMLEKVKEDKLFISTMTR